MSCRSSAGLTLVEVLTVVTVLSLLLGVGVPLVARLGDRSRMLAYSSSLLAHLYLARSEAIKRNARVVLCKSADGRTCNASGGWEQGWIVFHDRDNDARRADDEALLQQMPALPRGWMLVGNQGLARYISFHPGGGTRMVSGAFQAGTLTLCQLSGEAAPAHQLVINANGRPRMHKATLARCG